MFLVRNASFIPKIQNIFKDIFHKEASKEIELIKDSH
jgi:hypothetical protein